MIRSSHLSKLIYFIFLISVIILNNNLCIAAVDIWEKQKKNNEQDNQVDNEKDITIESPILSDEINKITINIEENTINNSKQSVIGIFDPAENNFNLNMWSETDGI